MSEKEEQIVVRITARRTDGQILFTCERAENVSDEEFEYYLSQIVEGLEDWIKKQAMKKFFPFELKEVDEIHE